MKIYLSKPDIICSAGKTAGELFAAVIKADNSNIRKRTLESGAEFFVAGVEKDDFAPVGGEFDSKLIRMENAALEQIAKTVEKALQKYGAKKIGVCVGSCDNLTELSGLAHLEYFTNGAFGDYSIEKQSAQYVARFAKEKFALCGPCTAFSTACSSSAGAIIKAAQLIKSGVCDAVIAGGVDIASDTALLGFNSLEAISSEPTNPFSKNRHGITLGEAAAFFVLCREDLDETHITLAGYGESADAYHMTSPDPEGTGAITAMQKALKSAGIEPKQIGYLNLHGTGTKFNDSMESKAVDAVFGDYRVPCSSTKGTTGHTLGAAAALELAICFEVIGGECVPIQMLKSGADALTAKSGEASGMGGDAPTNAAAPASVLKNWYFLPAQHWDGVLDDALPALKFVSVPQQNAEIPSVNVVESDNFEYCMSNSFAFGGSNASLIIKKE